MINEDRIAGGGGFPTHPHRDMEILTYVISGVIEHRDSTGNREVIRAGEVQRMTAGSGIRHSEVNASASKELHLLQILIHPEKRGLAPSYEQKAFDVAGHAGEWQLIASREGADAALQIHQDARLYAILLEPGMSASMKIDPGRGAWLQVAQGSGTVAAGSKVWKPAGDGLAPSNSLFFPSAQPLPYSGVQTTPQTCRELDRAGPGTVRIGLRTIERADGGIPECAGFS